MPTPVATGTLALTNQAAYFVSQTKSFQIPYKRLMAVLPFEGGIGLLRGGDGWLLYNLVMNFSRRVADG